jgi:hypothetical protein
MAKLRHAGDIEISDDPRFSRGSWIAERLGWGILGSVLLAAILGGLGPGLFSSRSAVGPSILVDYDRFGNLKTDQTVTVQLHARPEDQGAVSLWIDKSFLDGVTIQDILPQPIESRPGSDRTTFVFAAPERPETVTVWFSLVPEKPGRLSGRFGRESRGVEVRQFIYP